MPPPPGDAFALAVDPLFAAAAAGDCRLASASPAVGTGLPIPAAVPAGLDFDGYPRPASAVDLGAFQYHWGILPLVELLRTG